MWPTREEYGSLGKVLTSAYRGPSGTASQQRKVRTANCGKCLLMASLRDGGVPPSTIQAICDRMWLNLVRPRQILYADGNRATHLYAIRSGRVKLLKVDACGRTHVSTVLESGDLFGFEAIFGDAYSTGAEALTECEVCLASGEELKELMAEVPRIGTDLARYLHIQLSRARDRQVVVAALGAPAKMAGYILQNLSEKADPTLTVTNDLTLKDLGGILGLSPETVCRVLGDFKTRGIIEASPSGFRVRNLASLRRMAGV